MTGGAIESTCASEEEAGKIALLLIERGLAACVNVAPGVLSYYRWKGKIETSNEWLLLIKSSPRELHSLAVATTIEAAHSYEMPEVIALPIVDGSANYLRWLGSSLGPAGGTEA